MGKSVVRHLGNNAVSDTRASSTIHVGGGVNSGGMGDNAVSNAGTSSTIAICWDFGGGDVGEGIHLSLL